MTSLKGYSQVLDDLGRVDEHNPVLLRPSTRPYRVVLNREERDEESLHDALPLRSYAVATSVHVALVAPTALAMVMFESRAYVTPE